MDDCREKIRKPISSAYYYKLKLNTFRLIRFDFTTLGFLARYPPKILYGNGTNFKYLTWNTFFKNRPTKIDI